MPKGPKPSMPPSAASVKSTTVTPRKKPDVPAHRKFEEVFPAEAGPRQIQYTSGEATKVFNDDEHFTPVQLDRGALLVVWELVEAETRRKWGSSLASQEAMKRATASFRQAYKEASV